VTEDNRRVAIQQDLQQCSTAMKAARALRDMDTLTPEGPLP